MKSFQLLLLLSLVLITESKNCNPFSCRGTYCCNIYDQCAASEDQCVQSQSICSTNCQNGCCIGNRCGTQKECQSFPLSTVLYSAGGVAVLLAMIAIYHFIKRRRLARMRIVPGTATTLENISPELISTGTVVKQRKRTFNPPIQEAQIIPFKEGNISTDVVLMAQPVMTRRTQRFDYDKIEYGSAYNSTYSSPQKRRPEEQTFSA